MREIKFRAWDKENKKMLPVNTLSLKSTNINVANHFSHDIPDNPSACHMFKANAVLMQFTGLLDKNGVEIYEGDILKSYTTYPLEVYWMGIAWGFRWKGDEQIITFEDDEESVVGNKFKYLEVIGNKYSNPELLAKEQAL